jgi:hypothetical protein
MSQNRAVEEPSDMTRTVTWGDALVVASFHSPRGLRGAVEQIHRAVGAHIGTRNTFGKLYKAHGPHELDPKDRYRAWLLLAALGQDPKEWGIGDDDVPAGQAIDLDGLKRFLVRPPGLEPGTRWIWVGDNNVTSIRPRNRSGARGPRSRAA